MIDILSEFKRSRAYLELLKSQNESKKIKGISISPIGDGLLLEVLMEVNMINIIYQYSYDNGNFKLTGYNFIKQEVASNIIQNLKEG